MSGPILVVDDEVDLAESFERLLKRHGWPVVTATSRGSALEALRVAAAPALVLVDRHLPDGDGLDVLRAARARGAPVIVMSGHTSVNDRDQALAAGAMAFLGKPLTTLALLDLVRAVVGDPPAA